MIGSLDLVRLLNDAPKAIKIYDAARRAADGDEAALAYLKSEGWREGLDLIRPGAADVGQQIFDRARQAVADIRGIAAGDVIEGEYREIKPAAPWSGFLQRLERQRFGGHIVIGEPGGGKTQLAKKLAYRWKKKLGRQVEFFGAYPEDVPDWATSMGMRTLVHRMDKLQAYLDAHEGRDPDEEDDEEGEEPRVPTLPPSDRIIVIDESSMTMSTSALDPRRNAVIKALANCRHIGWNVVTIAQMTGLLALPLLGQTTIWVKKPSGAELETDRDNQKVKALWRNAMEAFDTVPRSPWWPAYPDMRAWCYVESPSVGGQPGYKGLVPFKPAPDVDEE